jgi:hypothetical protein
MPVISLTKHEAARIRAALLYRLETLKGIIARADDVRELGDLCSELQASCTEIERLLDRKFPHHTGESDHG